MPATPNPEAITIFISAFSTASFGFILYHLITNSPAYKLWESQSTSNAPHVIIQRMIGVLFFGLGALAVMGFYLDLPVSMFGTKAPNRITLIWILVLSAVIIPMNYVNSRDVENLSQYPQIRNQQWSVSLLISSALSWVLYLLAYEFLFRGFLLFASLPVLGLWPSILLNTALYSLVHIPKGSKETLGAIPFGILLSYLAVESGSFWIAFFAHVVLALSNEWFSFLFHPKMQLIKSKS